MGNEIESYVKTVFSNRLDRLADALAEQLFAPGTSLFERRYVIVPHEQIKEFLHFYLASKLGIASGMQICCIEQGVAELLECLPAHEKKRVPSFLELSVLIEEEIHICLSSDALRSDSECAPLYEYIQAEGMQDERILALSDQLARLFIRYALYGGTFLSEWLLQRGWQQRLWRRIFFREGIMSLDRISESDARGAKVHLFGFSYLPAAYLSFFARCRSVLYLFSPCAQYWDDFCSDKEKLSIQRRLHSLNARPIVCEEMQQYLQDHHTLLANWGKLGREFIKSLDGYSLETMEIYEPSDQSLLGCVKNSMLYLDLIPPVLQGQDRSIQVHSAPSKLREVEALRDVISTLLARHASEDPIQPQDILVLAPDMAEYASYIHMVFGTSPYAYRIEGLPQGSTSDFCLAFYHFLSFFEEDFSLSSILKLFYFRSFRKRWGFSLEDVHLISSWLERAQVRTGDKSWQEGIDRLVFGLGVSSDGDCGIRNIYPLNCIGQSDVELFNRFLICYHSLKKDIQEMRSSSRKSLSEWLRWIEDTALRQCEGDSDNEPFIRDLRLLLYQSSSIASKCFSFVSIQRILRHLYDKRTGTIAAAHLQHIRFCSMHSGAAQVHRIIYILGLDEEHFPRFEAAGSLCALSKSLKKPYIPSKGDEDRYLFLELLCSAQDYFIVSYERINAQDNKLQGPSYLIEELRAYVNKGSLGAMLEIDHPFLPFDAMYFAEDAPICNLNPSDFQLAKSYYHAEFKARQFFTASDNIQEYPSIVPLSSLRALARNPTKFYLNQGLGIYLTEEKTQDEERFCLSNLSKYALKKASLKADLGKVVSDSERQGILPEGMFKQVALQGLFSELKTRQAAFEQLQVQNSEIFSVELSVHCRSPLRQENGNWIVPALSFELREQETFHVIGTLSDITCKGYIVHGKKDAETLFSEWPLYLVFLHVAAMIGGVGGIPGKMLFSKDAKELEMPLDNPLGLLKNYMGYYARARRSLSPLKPKWASCLLLKTQEDFERTVNVSLHKQEGFYSDTYEEWMKKSRIVIDPKQMYAEWAADLKRCFEPLLSHLDSFDA